MAYDFFVPYLFAGFFGCFAATLILLAAFADISMGRGGLIVQIDDFFPKRALSR